mmetsp:Transcript_15232/g.27793  ORF Transcript_15232/g.27793 Transcript_15232/m.27793 type:complete len:219 (+) Transcript_15232:2-658(+)
MAHPWVGDLLFSLMAFVSGFFMWRFKVTFIQVAFAKNKKQRMKSKLLTEEDAPDNLTCCPPVTGSKEMDLSEPDLLSSCEASLREELTAEILGKQESDLKRELMEDLQADVMRTLIGETWSKAKMQLEVDLENKRQAKQTLQGGEAPDMVAQSYIDEVCNGTEGMDLTDATLARKIEASLQEEMTAEVLDKLELDLKHELMEELRADVMSRFIEGTRS